MSLYEGCPGAIRIREAVPEYIDCPQCGKETEIWSDELVARCHHCQALVRRERGPSCIDWCHHAEECIGTEAHERLRRRPEDSPSEVKALDEKSQGKT